MKIQIGAITYTLTESQAVLLSSHELKTKPFAKLGRYDFPPLENGNPDWRGSPQCSQGHYIQARTDNHLDERFRRPGSARRAGATAHALVRKGLLIEGLSKLEGPYRWGEPEGRTKVQEFFLTPDALSLRSTLRQVPDELKEVIDNGKLEIVI